MKKYLLLIFVAGFFTLTSCSSDDDGDTETGEDRIVGTWVLVDVNPPQIMNIEDCPEQSTITLNQDQSGSGTFYREANDCEPEQTSGNWSYEGDSVYRIEVPVLGSQPGTVEFEGANKFYFSSKQITGVTLTFQRK